MPNPLRVPRVNNNDDQVTIVSLAVKEGEFVKKGQIVGSVETDKAVLDVEAERDGIVLKIVGQAKEQAAVGSVLLWVGDSADESVPADGTRSAAHASAISLARPTAKARALLKEFGLSAEQIPATGERLSEADVEAWLAARGRTGAAVRGVAPPLQPVERVPDVAGTFEELSADEKGMLGTVLWHRDHASAGYIEIEYDPGPWDDYAKRYAVEHRLLMPPLMPLMARRLVQLAAQTPRINSTIVDRRRYRYAAVNLGFTVQAGPMLYLIVVRDADRLEAKAFIDAMSDLQRRAMSHRLAPGEMSGATIAFTSMARWNVSRHVPILPPQTGLIVAHSAPRSAGNAVLGASYDHRLLSGFDVVQALQALAQPPQPSSGEDA